MPHAQLLKILQNNSKIYASIGIRVFKTFNKKKGNKEEGRRNVFVRSNRREQNVQFIELSAVISRNKNEKLWTRSR